MVALSRTLGDSPRAKLIEALIRLGDSEITRGELAKEAGLYRASANRVIPALVREGLVARVRAGSRPIYRANVGSAKLQLFAQFAAAFDFVDLSGIAAPELEVPLGRIFPTVGPRLLEGLQVWTPEFRVVSEIRPRPVGIPTMPTETVLSNYGSSFSGASSAMGIGDDLILTNVAADSTAHTGVGIRQSSLPPEFEQRSIEFPTRAG